MNTKIVSLSVLEPSGFFTTTLLGARSERKKAPEPVEQGGPRRHASGSAFSEGAKSRSFVEFDFENQGRVDMPVSALVFPQNQCPARW